MCQFSLANITPGISLVLNPAGRWGGRTREARCAAGQPATSWWSAAASTASASRATPPAAASGCCWSRRTISPATPRPGPSKLIHGGLRYLEYYEFRLVREALIEREVLLRAAPHIVRPLTFVLPHAPEHAAGLAGPRSASSFTTTWAAARSCPARPPSTWRRRLKARRSSPGCQAASPTATPASTTARLVALNAVDAAERGAAILTRTRCDARRARGRRLARDARGAGAAGARFGRNRSSTRPGPGSRLP